MKKVLTTYKVGDYVDIKVDGAIHKGMPFKYYHGRTGTVFNVNQRAIGVSVLKQVRNRKQEKRLNIRVEHLRPSACKEGFLKRIRENDKLKAEAKKAGKRISTKRVPHGPRDGHVIKPATVVYQNPEVFREVF